MLRLATRKLLGAAVIRRTPTLGATGAARGYHENIISHYESPRNVGECLLNQLLLLRTPFDACSQSSLCLRPWFCSLVSAAGSIPLIELGVQCGPRLPPLRWVASRWLLVG